MNYINRFFKEEDGMGTVEIVIIVAILIGIALLFGKQIKDWVDKQLESITSSGDKGVGRAIDPEQAID